MEAAWGGGVKVEVEQLVLDRVLDRVRWTAQELVEEQEEVVQYRVRSLQMLSLSSSLRFYSWTNPCLQM